MGDVRDIKDAAWAAYCKAPTCRDMGRSKVDAAVDSVLAISARAEVPEGFVLVPREPTSEMVEAARKVKGVNGVCSYDSAMRRLRAGIAATPQPAGECCDTPACCFRDAYVGAREDLSDWKGRAQRAEAELRRLGYAGIDASVPPSQPAGEDGPSVYVECRQCDECEHVGINDEHDADAACHDCEWHGPAPVEDKCPGCGRDGTMTAACPKCSGRYTTLAVTEIPAPPEPAPSAPGDGCGACGDACNGGPCRLAQESPPTAPADVEALADEIGTESRKSGGVRLWEFSAVELREFARRLSGAQQADPVEELPAIATDIPKPDAPAPVEG